MSSWLLKDLSNKLHRDTTVQSSKGGKREDGVLYFTASWDEERISKLVFKTTNDKGQNSRLQILRYCPWSHSPAATQNFSWRTTTARSGSRAGCFSGIVL